MDPVANPNITLRQLTHFVAAAEAGTMSGAARMLRLAPSAVSMSIAELEKVVGAQLCVKRKSKGITLTSAGRSLYLQAQQMLDIARDMIYVSGNDGSELRGPLAIGCFFPLTAGIVPDLLETFVSRYPLIDVQFAESYHADLQADLLDGSLDLGITYDSEVAPELYALPFASIGPHVLVSESSPLAELREVTPRDLADQEILMFDGAPLVGRVLDIFRDEDMEPSIRYRMKSFATVRALVGRGMGTAVLYDSGAFKYSYEGRRVISRPLTTGRDYTLDIAILRLRSASVHARARAWIDVVFDNVRHGSPSTHADVL